MSVVQINGASSLPNATNVKLDKLTQIEYSMPVEWKIKEGLSMTGYKEPCGCRYTNQPLRWIALCSTHQAEVSETRARWAEERKATMADFDAAVEARRAKEGKKS